MADNTAEDNALSIMASNVVEENAMSSGPATSTPGRDAQFSGFRDNEEITTYYDDQIEDYEDEFEDTVSNTSYDAQDYEMNYEEGGRRVKSVCRRVQKSISSQTDLHNLSKDSIDLEWDEFIDRYYEDLGADIVSEWEKMCRDAKAVRRWAKTRIQSQLREFEDYSTSHTDPNEFSL